MFPMGIRIWDQNRMIYPVKFSVYLDLEKNISSIKTLIEGKKYQTFNYMMLTTGIAINGYIYEKDILMIDGEEDKVGIVEFDKMAGAFVVKAKDETFTVNEAMEFCEILGNVYEDSYLLEQYSLTFNDNIISENFTTSDDDLEGPLVKEVSTSENTKEKPKQEAIKFEAAPIVEEKKDEVPEVLEEATEVTTPMVEESVEIIEESAKETEGDLVLSEETLKEEAGAEKVVLPPWRTEEKEEILPEIKEETISESESKEVVEIVELPELTDDTVVESEVDSNLVMGVEDLPFLSDEDIIDEPVDSSVIPDVELLSEIEKPQEELPPDDVFGDGVITEVKPKTEEKITAEEVVIYTVGYCPVEDGAGTFSYILRADGKDVKVASGGLSNTILNRIQLIGVIEALKNIKECDSIKVYCDSRYVISPFIKSWIYKWQANDWKKDSENKVLNSDLWEEIYNLTENFSIQWEFVKDVTSMKETSECLEKSKNEIEKYLK